MRNVTLTADSHLIDSADERARAEHTTLNDQFRLWLTDCVERRQSVTNAVSAIDHMQCALNTGGSKFMRGEMNGR